MKQRISKIFALLLSLTMVTGMLAGCGSDKTESTDAAAQTEAAQEGKKTFVFGEIGRASCRERVFRAV